ncbi:hypothetical protein AAIH70_25810 [Neorhizobium sp. BT27B]|uniref:hypothetical protein n=1 Tax=Neorhizobium sp. BT27B TaxID=3142625 RepID=UPI003D2BADEE
MIYRDITKASELMDGLVMVEVQSDGTARIRSVNLEPRSAYHSTPEALSLAGNWLMQKPETYSSVVVFLSEGAVWDDKWGQLSDTAPYELAAKPFR